MPQEGGQNNSTKAVQVRVSEDRGTFFLTFLPEASSEEAPSLEAVYAECEKVGFPRAALISPERLSGILADAITKKAALEDLPLNANLDAVVRLAVSKDRRKATLYLRKERGSGKQLTLQGVGKAIRALKLRGMNSERVKRDVLEFYKSSTLELKGYVLAEGKASQAGQDGQFVWELEFLNGKPAAALRQQCQRNAAPWSLWTHSQSLPCLLCEEWCRWRKESKSLRCGPEASEHRE